MQIKLYCLITLLLTCSLQMSAQSYAFGAKGGLVLASQNWNGFNRDPLFGWSGDFFIESYSPNDRTFAFGASLGYHERGSVMRYSLGFGKSAYGMTFGNIMLNLYAKQLFDFSDNMLGYYHFGLRGECNVVQDFELFHKEALSQNVNRFTYGMSAGGGILYMIGDLTGGFVEFSVMPDFSKQVFIPAARGVTNPRTGQLILLEPEEVINFSLELTVGIYLVHLIEYID